MTEKRVARSRAVIKGRTVKMYLTIDDEAVDRYEVFLNGELVRGVYRAGRPDYEEKP